MDGITCYLNNLEVEAGGSGFQGQTQLLRLNGFETSLGSMTPYLNSNSQGWSMTH